ncbi:hypothetical protein [Amycolatopsis minnesotensis]|uniref:hypothetical protein n=1 Tax=Amycolatopsis minnesotensis TaxID=337894 RepID=UPI0031D20515
MATKTLVRGVRVFDGRRLSEPSTVVIDGAVFGTDGTGAHVVVDADGGTALPGLIDAHLPGGPYDDRTAHSLGRDHLSPVTSDATGTEERRTRSRPSDGRPREQGQLVGAQQCQVGRMSAVSMGRTTVTGNSTWSTAERSSPHQHSAAPGEDPERLSRTGEHGHHPNRGGHRFAKGRRFPGLRDTP